MNRALVSGAYRGFSNVWGSQVMPFTEATFDTWPVSATEMEPHYRAILEEVPLAGEEDNLAELFPLIGMPTPLPSPIRPDRSSPAQLRSQPHETRTTRRHRRTSELAFEASAESDAACV